MIKKVLNSLFIFISLNVLSQEVIPEKIFISDSLNGESGKFYMEGKEINLSKTFLDSKNIKEIVSYFGKSADETSGTRGAYLITRKNKTPIITLQNFVEKIKLENESIKKVESINIIIDGFLIQDFTEYKIEPSCVLKMNIIINDSKGVSHSKTNSTIEIITNIKDN